MRKKLKHIGSSTRRRYHGIFVRLGCKSGYWWRKTDGEIQGRFGKETLTLLLKDVMDAETGEILTDHLWFNLTKGFSEANPASGDILAFDARVKEYQKGYMGEREDVYKPIQTDYLLSHPTRIENLSHPERMRKLTTKTMPARANPYADNVQEPPATEAQKRLILKYCNWAQIEPPAHLDKQQARAWLNRHDINAYARWASRQAAIARGEKTFRDVSACIEKGMGEKETCDALHISSTTFRKYQKKYLGQ